MWANADPQNSIYLTLVLSMNNDLLQVKWLSAMLYAVPWEEKKPHWLQDSRTLRIINVWWGRAQTKVDNNIEIFPFTVSCSV